MDTKPTFGFKKRNTGSNPVLTTIKHRYPTGRIFGRLNLEVMSLIDEIEMMSEQEVIRVLQENGIQVIMKPMALIHDSLESYDGLGRQPVGVIQTDIYDALRKLEVRKKVIGDPFS